MPHRHRGRRPAQAVPAWSRVGKLFNYNRPPISPNVGLHVVPLGMKAVGERGRTIAGMQTRLGEVVREPVDAVLEVTDVANSNGELTFLSSVFSHLISVRGARAGE